MATQKLRVFLLTSILSAILAACTYAPEEEYYKNVPQADVTITLDTFNDVDTIYLYGETKFSFNVTVNTGTADLVKVFLDQKLLWQAPTTSGWFLLNQQNYQPGTYTLRIKASCIHTRSIADNLDLVCYEVERKWIVKIQI